MRPEDEGTLWLDARDGRANAARMNRESEARLLEFCVEQHRCFGSSAWLAFDAVSRIGLAAAAHFLAGVDWFGKPRELLRVVEMLQPGGVGNFSALARESRFDVSRS
jgi:hypothetical protein